MPHALGIVHNDGCNSQHRVLVDQKSEGPLGPKREARTRNGWKQPPRRQIRRMHLSAGGKTLGATAVITGQRTTVWGRRSGGPELLFGSRAVSSHLARGATRACSFRAAGLRRIAAVH